MVNEALRLSLQLDIPVEIIAPALVEVIGREAAAVILQLPTGRTDRLAVDRHVRLARGAPAFLEVARRAGGRDILPRRPPALGARHDMIEGQFLVAAAIDAREAVAKEQVESRERRIFVGPDELS